MAETFYRGENRIIERSLFYNDGNTPLPVSALASATLELWQGDTLQKTLVVGTDPELRVGDEAAKIEFELTRAIGQALSPGVQLTLCWNFEKADSRFTVDGGVSEDVEVEDVYMIADRSAAMTGNNNTSPINSGSITTAFEAPVSEYADLAPVSLATQELATAELGT